jgi:hypothetical protein
MKGEKGQALSIPIMQSENTWDTGYDVDANRQAGIFNWNAGSHFEWHKSPLGKQKQVSKNYGGKY